MDEGLRAAIEQSAADGRSVAVVTVAAGRGPGGALLVWAGGEALGDLGSPRLNQRVALFAETMVDKGGREEKSFDGPNGAVVVAVEVVEPS